MPARKKFSCVPLPGPKSAIDIEVHDDGSLEVDVGGEYGGSLSAAETMELADAIYGRFRIVGRPRGRD